MTDDLVKRLRERALLHMDDLTRDLQGVDPALMWEAADRIAALEAALREVEALDDNAECCGNGVSSGYKPPECCNQPEYGLDRAKRIVTRALEGKPND